MQTLTADVFISVDGWAGSESSPGYFGYAGPELIDWISAELAKRQVALFGRRTYEMLAGLPAEGRDDSWERMTQLDKVVFSSTLERTDWPNTRLESGDLVAAVGRLKQDGDVPLRTMGSLSLVRQLLGAGLVDRLRLMTFPLLVGPSGREPPFADVASTDLELVDHRVLDDRILLIEYRPTDRGIPTV